MTVKSTIKGAVRRLADRIAAPYVDDIVRQVAAPVPAHPDTRQRSAAPTEFFHGVLHELRTVELERLRGRYERIVSVGAQGRWYFEWIENALGPVSEHVGVEAFEPEPPDLPSYATWRPTTADRFDGVDDDCVDVVFAGQTTEHLWAAELAGFLLQARRVLRTDGLLVLDSPNRLVTEHLYWSHGGHTVELSADEISELVTLAGFSVESLRGSWRCRFGSRVLELEEGLGDGSVLVRRVVDGPDRPDDCFVWWLVARPSGEPRGGELTKRCEQLYSAHWSARVCRGMWPGPGADGPRVEPGAPCSMESLPFMLRPGRIRVGLRAAEGSLDALVAADLELLLPGEHTVHHRTLAEAFADGDELVWLIEQPELMFALTIRLVVQSSAPVRLAMPMSIHEVAA
jgi:SAM-dependent methyltransferase